jgi:hypothetical protein
MLLERTYEIERICSGYPNRIELVILCCLISDEMYLTVQIQADKHLQ